VCEREREREVQKLGTLLRLLLLCFSALGKFTDAVSDYLANIDHAPDPTVKREAFSSEITIAYDVLANTWIHSREPKVLNYHCRIFWISEKFLLS
jgi:hypothetical protein